MDFASRYLTSIDQLDHPVQTFRAAVVSGDVLNAEDERARDMILREQEADMTVRLARDGQLPTFFLLTGGVARLLGGSRFRDGDAVFLGVI